MKTEKKEWLWIVLWLFVGLGWLGIGIGLTLIGIWFGFVWLVLGWGLAWIFIGIWKEIKEEEK